MSPLKTIGCAALALMMAGPAVAPARAAETVTIGAVGQASANLWPVYHRDQQGLLRRRRLQARRGVRAVEQRALSSSSPPARSTSACRPASSIRSAPSRRARRSPSCASRCRRRPMRCWPSPRSSAQGAQGQDRLARRREGHHAHLSSSACWRRTASSPASSTWCSPARPRRALPRCRRARSMPRSCCRRSTSRPQPRASPISV